MDGQRLKEAWWQREKRIQVLKADIDLEEYLGTIFDISS